MNFMNSVVNFFKDGGVFLYPLALIFVVGVADRHRALRVSDARDHPQSQPVGHPCAGVERRKLQASGVA